jgi:hypothetical protein
MFTDLAATQYTGEPSTRDAFLCAVDGADWPLALSLARNLTNCPNPLPSTTCRDLGLPVGSSYGIAAQALLATPNRP